MKDFGFITKIWEVLQLNLGFKSSFHPPHTTHFLLGNMPRTN